jgi:hypothetical protein
VLNVLQDNVIHGGVGFTNQRGRSSSTRGIRAIREDVRINTALWGVAMTTLTTL